MKSIVSLLIIGLLSPLTIAHGQDLWPAFLGAGSEITETAELPLQWTATQNIAWQTALPGHGQSSPVIWGDRVFVTSVEGPMKDTYHTLCIEISSGKELWRRSFANSTPVENSYYVSRAAPTPVVDDDRVIALFESGDCVSYSHDGDQQWKRDLGKDQGPFNTEFGLGASLCQDEASVFALLEHAGPGCLLAIDKQTGQTNWKADRDPGKSWSSPMVMRLDGSTQIVVSSSGSVQGHGAVSGDVLWTYTDIGGNTSTTPIDTGAGQFLTGASPGRNGENAGSAADSNGMLQVSRDGETWKVNQAWIANGAIPSWASPIIHNGLAYWINRAGVVFCFDAKSGEKVYAERLRQSSWATPLAVGNRVYFFGKEGLVSVIASGREFQVLAENESWTDATLPTEQKLPEEKDERRRRGAAMFSKPTLYGVAVTTDSILMRVGHALICVRQTY